jgi:hypothetical protein
MPDQYSRIDWRDLCLSAHKCSTDQPEMRRCRQSHSTFSAPISFGRLVGVLTCTSASSFYEYELFSGVLLAHATMSRRAERDSLRPAISL